MDPFLVPSGFPDVIADRHVLPVRPSANLKYQAVPALHARLPPLLNGMLHFADMARKQGVAQVLKTKSGKQDEETPPQNKTNKFNENNLLEEYTMRSLIRYSPATDMRRLQREMDHLFGGLFPTYPANSNAKGAAWTPRVDLAETDESYLIHLDLPGIGKEDVEINFHDGTLTISGERKTEEKDENHSYVRVERSYGRFSRAFTLPQAVNDGNIEATFENGVLNINVPKAEEVKPRRIKIA